MEDKTWYITVKVTAGDDFAANFDHDPDDEQGILQAVRDEIVSNLESVNAEAEIVDIKEG